jgi:hydroxyacylglutathione hydrolase
MLRIAGLLLFLAWGGSQAQDDTFLSPAITPAQLAEKQQTDTPLLVIDVRGKPEYRSGHVPGALNIPPEKLPKHLDELRAANGVVLYCSNGSRTRIAEATLAEYDIPNLFHLEGGVFGWRNSGHQLLSGWGPP